MLTWAATTPPAFRKAYPGLHLPADLAGKLLAIEQRRGHRGIAAIGGDHRLRGLAPQPDRRTRGTKRHDLVIAIEIFADAVAQRALVGAKQLIEHGDVVGHQRRLIALELRGHFGEHVGQIDFHSQNPFGRGAAATPGALQRIGDAQRDVFAPGRRDDLHADRHRIERDRRRDHRQADEGYRLGVDADIGAHRQFDAVEHEGLLPEFWRDAGRRRRDDHIDRFENLQHLRAVPAAKFLRAIDKRCRESWRPRSGGRAPPDRNRSGACAGGRDAATRLRRW